MARFRLFSGADDASLPQRPADRLRADDLPPADDPVTRELRALYAAPGERYWDEFEGRIMAAVRAGARPARAAADWWQAMAEWTRPGLAAAAVLVVVVGAINLQSRGARTSVAAAPELTPLDPELARAVNDATSDPVAEAADRAAQEAAYLLTGGLKRRAPVRLDTPAATPAAVRDVTPPTDADEVLRARREATFRYVMPD